MTRNHALLAALALTTALCATATAVDIESEYATRIGIREVAPAAGQRAELEEGHDHLIVQFYEIPDGKLRQRFAAGGISLLRYVGGNAYIVSLAEGGRRALAAMSSVRATVAIEPEMKISPLFIEAEDLRIAVEADSTISVYISFHEDVPFQRSLEVIRAAGLGTAQEGYLNSDAIELEAPWSTIWLLLDADEVELIEPSLPPPETYNRTAAERANVQLIYKVKAYKKPTGKRIKVGIWDAGQIYRHRDFGSRLTIVETDRDVHYHSTAVCGTIAGAGFGNSRAKGMAPRVKIYSYNFYGAPIDEMEQAIAQHDVMISNNSWGTVAGWDYDPEDNDTQTDWRWFTDSLFGYYHSVSGSLDRMVRNNNFPVVWAAGNSRNDSYLGPHRHGTDTTTIYEDLHPPNPIYGCLTTYSLAKNVITVGATMDDDYITSFSSFGPTGDGRLKPDICANGYDVLTTDLSNEYEAYSGTSLSTPVVTGTAALLMHSYRSWYKDRMGADLLKALLVNTARDLGRPGPDFTYGYGMVDAQLAARVLRASVTNTLTQASGGSSATGIADVVSSSIIEGSVDRRQKDTYTFTIPSGAAELRATLVWNDPSGSSLVNDLDLWLVKPRGGRALPFSLDPNNPTAPARRKRNGRDNVEHVLVENPQAGNWKVIVRGRRIPQGPQSYVLIVSAGEGNNAPTVLSNGQLAVLRTFTSSSQDLDNVEEDNTFTAGDTLRCFVNCRILDNADYGPFYGTVAIQMIVRRGSETIVRFDTAGDVRPNEPGYYWRWPSTEYVIPEEMSSGTYTLVATVTMHNGASGTASYTFTVE